MSDKMSLQVLELVLDSPAHCHDIADELEISMKTASALLSDLWHQKLIIRKHKVKGLPGTKNHLCWVYEKP
jgi:DNA-binding IclR family transcriptional regulator